MGPAPGTPGFAASQAQREAELARKGYVIVCSAALDRYALPPHLQPLATATAGLAIVPVDLSRTPFAQFRSLGGMPETVGDIKSRFYRSFRDSKGHTLTLFEHDMLADGVRSYRDPKLERDKVNGLPARLMVMQAPSKAVSVLSWNEGRRYYELWIDANVVSEHTRAQFIALAESIPKSRPARPNEPKPEPLKVGPDGLPIIDTPIPPPVR